VTGSELPDGSLLDLNMCWQFGACHRIWEAAWLFSYDGRSRRMMVSGEIWRELRLSGHWIQDALIQRWGELTSEISRQAISPSEVIDRLLRIPVCRRNIDDARPLYLDLPSKKCVWSRDPIGRTFDIDHVLPFS